MYYIHSQKSMIDPDASSNPGAKEVSKCFLLGNPCALVLPRQAQHLINLQQANFEADPLIWLKNDVMHNQMALGREKSIHPCPRARLVVVKKKSFHHKVLQSCQKVIYTLQMIGFPTMKSLSA